MRTGRARQIGWLVREFLSARDGLEEELADLRPILMDGRHEDVRRRIVRELDDQLGQIGLVGGDARHRQRVVQLDLVGGQRLHLDDLAGTFRAHQRGDDGVGLGGVACPVDVPAGALHGCL